MVYLLMIVYSIFCILRYDLNTKNKGMNFNKHYNILLITTVH